MPEWKQRTLRVLTAPIRPRAHFPVILVAVAIILAGTAGFLGGRRTHRTASSADTVLPASDNPYDRIDGSPNLRLTDPKPTSTCNSRLRPCTALWATGGNLRVQTTFTGFLPDFVMIRYRWLPGGTFVQAPEVRVGHGIHPTFHQPSFFLYGIWRDIKVDLTQQWEVQSDACKDGGFLQSSDCTGWGQSQVFFPYGLDTCKQGFFWREANPVDHVCVTREARQQARDDNASADRRRSPTGGPYGPDTCASGFVWREAFPDDHVCVAPLTRDQTALDNSLANLRRVF